jgi:predicted ATPase/DNA-binding SARP family transcriptional activator
MDAPWRIKLLGTLHATLGDRVVTRFRSQKIAALFAYLAYDMHRSHSRDELIDRLWPECDPDVARNRLRVSLTSLRRQLEPPGVPAGTVIVADRAAVQLNPHACVTDVTQFEAAIEAADRAEGVTVQLQRLTEAVALYRGALLPDLFDSWVLQERQRLAEAFVQTHSRLSALLVQMGDLPRAIDWARRAVRADPLREESHRDLMRLLAAAGQPEAALGQFRELEGLLAAELGTTPEAESRDLARRIAESLDEPRGGRTTVAARVADYAAPSPAHSPAAESLPTGTVTFLVTDLVGRASLQAQDRTAWDAALQSYHELLRPLFRGHGGHEVRANGEMLQVAFGRATDALAAAVAGQRELATHRWPADVGALRARMALHTGEVQPGDAVHASPALQSVTRLLLAAHGGQILLSASTAGLIRDELLLGLRLSDLGLYRLGDEAMPERLFQATYPDMDPREFPPLNALPGQVGNLPLQFTRFFGREDEIARLRELLLEGETRLVTLTGPGGTGKTRLALEVAVRLREPLRGAVWSVPLAPLSDAAGIVDKVLDVLRLARSPDLEPLEQVVDALSRQPALLLLDNFEHVAPLGAPLVRTLLERVPTLTCLVTSRQRLDLSGEREVLVPPLPTPEITDSPEGLTGCASVQLFVDRAQAVRPDFQVTRRNAATVAELCRRLEGIPLALELAAARASMLTPGQMLARLADRYEFLVSRQRDAAPRHRSLRAAIGWSYSLLAPELQRFFAQLCVFRGGWTLSAAEAVCEQPLALEYLERLRECSLVEVEAQGEQARYRLLETLREYADEQLTREERIALRWRHLHYYLALAEEADPHLGSAALGVWLDRLEAEHDNLRAAMAWSLESGVAEEGLRLLATVWLFWRIRGYHREGLDWFQRVLPQEWALVRTTARATALFGAGELAWLQSDLELARSLLEESIAIGRELGDKRIIARAMLLLGHVAGRQGEAGAARAFYEEGLTIGRELEDKWIYATALRYMAGPTLAEGNDDAARSLLTESLGIHEELGDPLALIDLRDDLGAMALLRGDYAAARAFFEEGLALRREVGEKFGIAGAHRCLAEAARLDGDYAMARALYAKSLVLFREGGSKLCIAYCLEGLGAVANEQGEPERAARLLGAAAVLREACGARGSPGTRNPERCGAAVRAVLGEEAFAAAWTAGRAMTLEEAICAALADSEMPTTGRHGS